MAVNNQQSLNLGALGLANDDEIDAYANQLEQQVTSALARASQPAPPPTRRVSAPVQTTQRNESAFSDLGTAFKAGVYRLPSAGTGLVDAFGNLVGGENLASRTADTVGDYIGLDFDGAADQFGAQEYSLNTLAGRQAIADAQGFTSTLQTAVENPVAALTMATESLPGMIAGGVLGKLAKGAGLVKTALGGAALGEAAISTGLSQADRAAEGDTSAGGAAASLAQGAAVGVLGRLGGSIAARLGVSDPDVLLAGGGRGKGAARFFARVTGGAISEGVFEEMPQSIVETMIDNFYNGEDLTKGVGNSAALGLVLGGVMGGAFNILPGQGAGRDADAAGGDVPDTAGQRPDLPPDVAQSIMGPEGELKTREAFSALSNAAVIEEWERMRGLEETLLTETTPEAEYALGLLSNQMRVVSSIMDEREIRPEQRTLDGAVASYRAIRNALQVADAKLAMPRMKNREALRQKRIQLAQRLANLQENFTGGDLARGVAQSDFNESYLAEIALNKKGTSEEVKQAIESERAKRAEINQTYPDIEYSGSAEAEAAAKGQDKKKQRKAAEKKAAETQKKQTAEQASKQRLDSINPAFSQILQTTDPQIVADAREGMSDEANTQDIEKTIKFYNDPSVPEERVKADLATAQDEYDAQSDPKRGRAGARKKAAAKVAAIQNAMANRGIQAAQASTDQAATTTTLREPTAIYSQAADPKIELEPLTDDEIELILEDIKLDVGENQSFFTKKSREQRRNTVREMVALSPQLRAAELQKTNISKAKRAILSRINDAVDLEAAAEQFFEVDQPIDETLPPEQQVTQQVANRLLARGRAGEEIPGLTNMFKKDQTLTKKAADTATKYAAMTDEEFAGARPKNANQAQAIYDAVDAIRRNEPAPAPNQAFVEEAVAANQTAPTAPVDAAPFAAPAESVDVSADALELLDNWLLRARYNQLNYDSDELIAFGDLVEEMEDNMFDMEYLPYQYFATLMAQPADALAREAGSKTVYNAFAEDLQGDDLTALKILRDAALEFRAEDIANARAISSKNLAPVAAGTAEADDLLAATNFGIGEGPVMERFFYEIANNEFTSGEDVTKAIAKFFTLNRAPKTEQDVKRIIAKTAKRMYQALADMRGYATIEEAKVALPFLNQYLEESSGDARFSNLYWDNKYTEATNAENKIKRVDLPNAKKALAAIKDQASEEAVIARSKVAELMAIVDRRLLNAQVKAEQDWVAKNNFVTAKDKERRNALFYEEMVSTTDTATEDAALDTYDAEFMAQRDLNQINEDVRPEEAFDIGDSTEEGTDTGLLQGDLSDLTSESRDRGAIMRLLMDSVGKERVGKNDLGDEVIEDIGKRDIRREYNRRAKKAFALRALGYTEQDVYALMQIRARQEFLTEAVKVLKYRMRQHEMDIDAAVQPPTEAANEIRQILASERLPGKRKPSFEELSQYRTQLKRLLSLQASLGLDRDKWLSNSRVAVVQRSGIIKPLAGVTKLQEANATLRKKLRVSMDLVLRAGQRSIGNNDFNRKEKAPPVLYTPKLINQLMDSATEMYKVTRTQLPTETAEEYNRAIKGWRSELRERIGGALDQLTTRNQRLWKEGVVSTDPRRVQILDDFKAIIDGVQRDSSATLMGEAVNAISLNELRTRLAKMDDAKLRRTLMRAHIVDAVNQINDSSVPDVVEEAIITEKELQAAQELQRMLANDYEATLAQAETNAGKDEVTRKRRSIMDEYNARQEQLRADAATVQNNKYDASLTRGTKQYKERVAAELRKMVKDPELSVEAVVEKLRDAYLHNFWLKLPDNRNIALGEDGRVYVVIKNGKSWEMYAPTKPDAVPSKVADDQVGGRFRTLKSAQETIRDRDFQREVAQQFAEVMSVDQVEAHFDRIEANIRTALESRESLAPQVRAIRNAARAKVKRDVERLTEVLKRLDANQITPIDASSESPFNTHGETPLYRAIQTVLGNVLISEDSVEGNYLTDLSSESRQLRNLLGGQAPVSPKWLLQTSIDELYGPNPEKNIVSATASVPSRHERIFENGIVVTGSPANFSRKIWGLSQRSQQKLRNAGFYSMRRDTVTYVEPMSVTDLKLLAAVNNLPWDPEPNMVEKIVQMLRLSPEAKQGFGIAVHAPIVDTTSDVELELFNASVAEAWDQVYGDEKPIPVLRHRRKSEVSEDDIAAFDPVMQYRNLVESTNVHLLAEKPLDVAGVQARLDALGYDQKSERIRVVDRVADLPKIVAKSGQAYAWESGTRAIYVPEENRIYIVASNVSERTLLPVLAHEMSHRLFNADEVRRLADVVRGWASRPETDNSVEARVGRTAMAAVAGSLEHIQASGVSPAESTVNHEIVAYALQTILENGDAAFIGRGPTDVQMMDQLRNWVEGKSEIAPEKVKTPYLGIALRGMLSKLFARFGLSKQAATNITVTDLAAILRDKKSLDKVPPQDSKDVMASVAAAHTNARRQADRNLEAVSKFTGEHWLGLKGYIRRGTRRLQFLDVLIENNEHHFSASPELDGKNPLNALYDAKIRRQRDAQVIVEEINEVLNPLSQWSTARTQAVNKFIEQSTRKSSWGFVPDWPNAAQPERQDAGLAEEFRKFAPAEQQLIKDVFRLSEQLRNQLDSELEQEIIESFDEQIADATTQGAIDRIIDERQAAIDEFRKARGPRQAAYAKLQLEGGWAVSYISPELREMLDQPGASRKRIAEMKSDPKHYFVAFAESERLAERLRADMLTRYPAEYVNEVFPRMETNYRETMSIGLLQAIDQKLATYSNAADAAEDDAALASYKQLRKALNQVYVKQLAENDLRKSELGRENVPTYEQDMLGIFARNAKSLANNIAAVGTNRDIQLSMRVLTQQAQANTANRKQRMEVLNEVLRRHAIDTTYQENPVVNKLLSLTSFKMLLTSPGYYMQNAMQPIMYTLPRIAGDFGNGAGVMAALLREQKNMAKIWAQSTKGQAGGRLRGTLFKPELVKNQNHRALLEHLTDLNLFDVGLTAELGRIQTPGISASGGALQPVADMYRKLFASTTGAVRSVEIVNRGAAAIVAYDTYMKKAKPQDRTHQKAVEYATFIVRRTQGDYSFNNQPSAFKPGFAGEWARLATQFRSFQVIQWTILLQEFKRMRSDDPVEAAAARRTLMWLGVTHFSAAGALGLPLLGTANFVSKSIAAALGDEEEPADLEYLMYSRLGNNAWTDVLAHGFPSLMGIEATSKLGMGQGLITPFLEEEWTREYPALWVGTVMMGATGGLVGDLVGGVGLMADGYTLEGAARAFLPRGARDAVLALNNRVEGVRKYNPTRDQLISGEEFGAYNTFIQALGWRPMTLNMQQGQNRWLTQIRENMKDESSKIKGEYIEALDNKDQAGMREARKKWREYQQRRRQMGFQMQPMSLLVDARKDRARRESLTTGTGVQYQRSERVFMNRFEG